MLMIVLVENNVDDMRKLQSFVIECYPDSNIITFTDSFKASEFIKSYRFSVDLCFTEIVMPGISGFELATELREDNKHSKIVFIAETADYAVDAWKYNANDYLLKPVTLENVRHTLESCFAPV